MILTDDQRKNIEEYCSYVCNYKIYSEKLSKAIENDLFDCGVIYIWKLFLLYVYEKVWQIRELEKISGNKFETDKIFLSLIDPNGNKNLPDNFFDGNLYSLNKLQDYNKGETEIIAKLRDVYKEVDAQIFKDAQKILQERNKAAHVNSVEIDFDCFFYNLKQASKIAGEIQEKHKSIIEKLIENKGMDNIISRLWEDNFNAKEILIIHDSLDGSDINETNIEKIINAQSLTPSYFNYLKIKTIDVVKNNFLNAGAFDTARENIELLVKYKEKINKNDLKQIILGVSENNQIVGSARYSDRVPNALIEMLDFTMDIHPDLIGDWVALSSSLDGHSGFDNLKSKITEYIPF